MEETNSTGKSKYILKVMDHLNKLVQKFQIKIVKLTISQHTVEGYERCKK